jgi:NADH:ubiquinone oxidoreductase subunit 4 (subunit M)
MDNVDILAASIVIGLLLLICCVTGALAKRKGYKFIIWFFAGGIIGLIALCFLPFANSPESPDWEKYNRAEKGNNLGIKLVILNVLIGIVRFAMLDA